MQTQLQIQYKMRNNRFGHRVVAPNEAARDRLLTKNKRGKCDWYVEGEVVPEPIPTAETRKYGEEPKTEPKTERQLMKEQLNDLGVKYAGNASNATLKELLELNA